MKKILTLTVGLMIVASASMAQSGLNLYSADCSAGSTVQAVTNACTSNTGQAMNLVASCVMPVFSMNDFVGAATIIDLQSAAAALPDWWRADAAGCRSGAVTVLQDATVSPNCITIWDGQAQILPVFAAQPFVGGANRIRFNAGAAVPTPYLLEADGATELGVLKLTVTRTKSTGATLCAGCTTGACIVLNEINFQSATPGAPFFRVTNPASPNSNAVTYQAGAPTCGGSTPTSNRTWGSVKALYR